MILKQLYIDIDRNDVREGIIENDFRYLLYLQSRHICNYIEREVLKPSKINTKDFNRIVITLKQNETVSPPSVNTEKALIFNTTFNSKTYASIKENHLISKFFSKIITECFESLSSGGWELPTTQVKEALTALNSEEFVNEWVIFNKRDRITGLTILLTGRLTLSSFVATLQIENKKVKNEKSYEIFQSEPDERLFEYKFKQLKIINNDITILDKFGDTTYSISNISKKLA